MIRTLMAIGLAVIPGAAFGQSGGTPAAFDAADVHVSAHAANTQIRGGILRAGRYNVRTATMADLISMAYGMEAAHVLGGPSWLELDRFDITAKAPGNTPPDRVGVMLQSLLAERFKLKVHPDTRPMPGFVLSLGKGKPKLKPAADESGSSGCVDTSYSIYTCRNMSMAQFAQQLRQLGPAYVTSAVADQTGLEGKWDFNITWTPRAERVGGVEVITVFDAVDKQLGLKLEPKNLPTAVIVVDSVDRKPANNPPGTAAALPPPPLAIFDVASLKPSAPDATRQGGRIEHDRIDVQNMPLKSLILFAWDLPSDDRLAGAPKFLNSARFDISAKAPASEPGAEFETNDLRLMLRTLLEERFHLKTHMEERPLDGYALSAAKPKLSRANPINRTGCKEGPGPDGKDPRNSRPILSRLVTCQNITMAEFAEQLPTVGRGYPILSVLDSTGLTDAYDFTLSFSAAVTIQRLNERSAGAEAGGPSDNGGAVTLQDAIGNQLGLKLELKKRPMPVLVIDHLDETPTEN